jgi:hypothetical protein
VKRKVLFVLGWRFLEDDQGRVLSKQPTWYKLLFGWVRG